MKTEVFSWRVTSALKSQLEREARLRGTTVAAFVDEAVRARLASDSDGLDDEARQAELQRAAMECIGTVDLPDIDASANVSKIVRARIRERHGR